MRQRKSGGRGPSSTGGDSERSEESAVAARMELARQRGLLRRKAKSSAAPAQGGTGSGAAESLPSGLKGDFESKLGKNLDAVRVHTGADSQAAAESAGARAYTVGKDIHFNRGEYDPASPAGQKLLAHEVAHTLQPAGEARFKKEGAPNDGNESADEKNADAVADNLVPSGSTPSAAQNPSSQKLKLSPPKELADACPALDNAGALEDKADLDALIEGWWERDMARNLVDERNRELMNKAENGKKPSATEVENVGLATADFRAAAGELRDSCKSAAAIARATPDTSGNNAQLADQLIAYGEKQMQLATDSSDSSMRAAKQASATFRLGQDGQPFVWATVSKENDRFAIDRFLEQYGYDCDPLSVNNSGKCVFEGVEKTADQVADIFLEEADKAGWTFSRDVVLGEIRAMHAQKNPTTKGDGDQKAAPQSKWQLQASIHNNATWHANKSGNVTNDDQNQVDGTITYQVHDPDNPGCELSIVASYGFSTDVKFSKANKLWVKVDNVETKQFQLAAQAAYVADLIKDEIQAQAFLQAVAGQQADKPKDHPTEFKTQGQLVGGYQVMFNLGTKRLALFVGGQIAATANKGSPNTLDLQANAGLIVTILP